MLSTEMAIQYARYVADIEDVQAELDAAKANESKTSESLRKAQHTIDQLEGAAQHHDRETADLRSKVEHLQEQLQHRAMHL